MTFTIVRSATGGCDPNCPEWIYGEGQISAATPAAFRLILKQAGARRLPLVILSPGGDVMASIELGRIIRKQAIDVEVGATRYSSCGPMIPGCAPDGALPGEYRGAVITQGAFCWSACPLVLAGGQRRLSSVLSFTGVHQITTVYRREKVVFKERCRMVGGERKVISRKIISRKKAGTTASTRLPKATRKAMLAYFKTMGIKKELIDIMLSTPPDRIRRLSSEEMLDLGLITEVSANDILADPAACAAPAPAANCIRRDAAANPDADGRATTVPGRKD